MSGSVAKRSADAAASAFRLTYEVGLEHSPTNPWGRAVLTLDSDGSACVENRGVLFDPRAWRGRVSPEAITRLRAALASAGFPRGGQTRLVPDAATATVQVRDGGREATVELDWDEAQRLPGYREVVAILDGINHRLSGGALARGRDAYPDLVLEAGADALSG